MFKKLFSFFDNFGVSKQSLVTPKGAKVPLQVSARTNSLGVRQTRVNTPFGQTNLMSHPLVPKGQIYAVQNGLHMVHPQTHAYIRGVGNAQQVTRARNILSNALSSSIPTSPIGGMSQAAATIQTPSSSFQQLRQQAAQQHIQNLQRALYFGSATSPRPSGMTYGQFNSAMSALFQHSPGPNTTPLQQMMSNMSGQVRGSKFNWHPQFNWHPRPSLIIMDDLEENDPTQDPEYYTDAEVRPPDVADYTKVNFG